ncbi:hypothetical protein PROFUN_00820 [Planoprotostelium fungivorum]|uniref:Uncharacterized protein n=1 Tax=Planoprotostelium fungivorum TaxID=1890364 RepID=A0A2P6P022_9EUKA|nr:hypothetical protein PROFUN_00820 [Planoprotostelium fungivorum]
MLEQRKNSMKARKARHEFNVSLEKAADQKQAEKLARKRQRQETEEAHTTSALLNPHKQRRTDKQTSVSTTDRADTFMVDVDNSVYASGIENAKPVRKVRKYKLKAARKAEKENEMQEEEETIVEKLARTTPDLVDPEVKPKPPSAAAAAIKNSRKRGGNKEQKKADAMDE